MNSATALRVLVVDDDPTITRNFRFCLEDAGYTVHTAATAAQALQRLAEEVFDLCFLDLNIGTDSGLDLLPLLRAEAPWLRVVMATAENRIDVAVVAMQKGAADYLVKPCSPEQLLHAARRQAEACQMARQIEKLQESLQGQELLNQPMLESANPEMMRLLQTARQVADTDAAILLLGESGTGKNVLARAIHDWSLRRSAPFATVNCPSLNAELLESELFGHAKGAFTGASDNRLGRVQAANGGSLFLDEIGDFPLALQPKLLRFLQDQEYERVGDPKTLKANLRLIAATNADLASMVAEGRFRSDLFYRLNVITLTLPPLRERVDEIPVLALQFLRGFAARYRRPANRFAPAAVAALREYRWPGNIRELRNLMERVAILSPEDCVQKQHLPPPIGSAKSAGSGRLRVGDDCSLEQLERAHIEAVLARQPALDDAAQLLGINSSTLYRKRKQFGL